jgi:hypothetical protein
VVIQIDQNRYALKLIQNEFGGSVKESFKTLTIIPVEVLLTQRSLLIT